MTQGAKPVLAVDVDDVLFPLVPLFVEYHNEQHGTSATANDFVTYRFEDSLGIPEDLFVERFRKFWTDGSLLTGGPDDQAQEAIRQLAERFDLEIVTSRWQDFEEDTITWLQKHFPDTFKNIHFANSISWHRGDKRDKASICQKLGATYFIDDSLDNVLQVAATGVESLLFGNYAWNQADELPDNVRRVNDWNEVLEVLL